ncbi:MAG: hypothetical protein Q9225_005561 [Loekoesia sp. 1 TL-2023]
MAQNGDTPLTSIEIVQQQRYGISSASGFKRPFKQISSIEPHLNPKQSLVTAPLEKIASELPPSISRPVTLEPGRLTASKICRTYHETIKPGDLTTGPKIPTSSQPGSSLNPLLTLSHPRYGLPESLVNNFASMGIKHIYPWQSSCLLGRGLLTGEKNLVYTAPTGSGKSLVADVLMLKRVLGSLHNKAILVLPYVALVQEKVNFLRRAVQGVERDPQLPSQLLESKRSNWRTSSSVRIVGFFGGSKTRATWADVDIAVCTFEKAFD